MTITILGYQSDPTAASDVLAERSRQINVEGFDAAHDDLVNRRGELSRAAACYALDLSGCAGWHFRAIWPWHYGWWKPTHRRANLVKSAALIIADIERLDRWEHRNDPAVPPAPPPELIEHEEHVWENEGGAPLPVDA